MAVPEREERETSRTKQVVLVALLLLGLAVVVCATLIGWHHLPGVLGEWIGMMVGIMSTPFFLEASFLFIGLTIVLVINHHRQKKSGDDFVELEVKDPEDGGLKH